MIYKMYQAATVFVDEFSDHTVTSSFSSMGNNSGENKYNRHENFNKFHLKILPKCKRKVKYI